MAKPKNNFADKDLRNVNFSGDSLRRANLNHTSLEGAFLRGVDLTDADLTDADLRGAHLEGAQLGGANLQNADLTDADVRGARIEDAAVLDGVQLTNARGVPESLHWEETRSLPTTGDTKTHRARCPAIVPELEPLAVELTGRGRPALPDLRPWRVQPATDRHPIPGG